LPIKTQTVLLSA